MKLKVKNTIEVRTVCKILLAVVCLCMSFPLYGCDTRQSTVTSKHSVYDRVKDKGVIRCGYVLYKPGCMKDPNTGKLTGIGIEALELVGKRLNLTIDWAEECGWESMVEGLSTNRYDIIGTPIWPHAKRARVADFSSPLYYSPVLAYVKAGDKRFSDGNLTRLNSGEFTVGTIDGATAEQIANEEFPKSRRLALPQLSDFSQLLTNISTGKADITFTEPADAISFQKHNPNSIEAVTAAGPVRIFPDCWLIRRDQYEFKSMIDTVLRTMKSDGSLERIISKYEPEPRSIYRCSTPYRTPL